MDILESNLGHLFTPVSDSSALFPDSQKISGSPGLDGLIASALLCYSPTWYCLKQGIQSARKPQSSSYCKCAKEIDTTVPNNVDLVNFK